ncbi:quinoprotein relay system zinc metallohydrolase 2 [Sagittula marina]|uniref:Quinoprotein relay system zinc metallohydrolase 2 n=1 Tax=Sagittula marina TaxID=943940 RepID=A0A7W6DQW5_9RHOB|nr:quinoprotein relay system zinc metallohydrolase 2 [Sagittula marina]MBB3987488.1 quinoprotein relay system zinc metallohydrolase 2 [Sagittula marina]
MFEAVVLVCLNAGEGPCRDVLLPGAEAETQADCMAQLPDVPEFSVGASLGSPTCRAVAQELTLTEVAPGLWVHEGQIAEPDEENRGDVSNLAIVIGETSVAVIDSGSAAWMGEAAWRAIRQRTDLPVSHMILTHLHPDHVFGADVFARAGAEVVAHEGLSRALMDRQDNYLESLSRLIGAQNMIGTRVPEVDNSLSDSVDIDLGERTLELQAWPRAHTGTDLTVVDRATGTLIAGDLLFHGHTPALDGSLPGWQGALETLIRQPFVRAVPGHGAASLSWPDGAAPLERYLNRLATDTRNAVAGGERLGAAVGHIAESEAPNWQLFEAYNPRNATVAFTELEWE